MLFILTLLLIKNISADSCQPINFGIRNEKVLTYSIEKSDTVWEITTDIYFNKKGLTEKALSWSALIPDTSVTIMEYDSVKIIGWKEYQYLEKDSTIFTAVKWDVNGRGIKFIIKDEKDSFIEFQYNNNCTVQNKKVTFNNKTFYNIEYRWDEKLTKSTKTNYFGSLSDLLDNTEKITDYSYDAFDSNGNWTIRSYYQDEKQYIEYRSIEYYR